jgi:hypothetical protein
MRKLLAEPTNRPAARTQTTRGSDRSGEDTEEGADGDADTVSSDHSEYLLGTD